MSALKIDLLILCVLSGNGSNVYGLEIIKTLESFGISLSAGSLYPTLARLQKKGLVSSSLGPPEKGGAARSYWQLTQKGQNFLVQELEILNTLVNWRKNND